MAELLMIKEIPLALFSGRPFSAMNVRVAWLVLQQILSGHKSIIQRRF